MIEDNAESRRTAQRFNARETTRTYEKMTWAELGARERLCKGCAARLPLFSNAMGVVGVPLAHMEYVATALYAGPQFRMYCDATDVERLAYLLGMPMWELV